MARTINQQDDVSIVELAKLKVNQAVPPGVMEADVPPDWTVDVQKLAQENHR
jgi:hypothetical protein